MCQGPVEGRRKWQEPVARRVGACRGTVACVRKAREVAPEWERKLSLEAQGEDTILSPLLSRAHPQFQCQLLPWDLQTVPYPLIWVVNAGATLVVKYLTHLWCGVYVRRQVACVHTRGHATWLVCMYPCLCCASKLAPAHGRWQEASVLCHFGITRGCLSVLSTWQLAFPRMDDQRERENEQRESHMPRMYDLVSEVTLSLLPYSIF